MKKIRFLFWLLSLIGICVLCPMYVQSDSISIEMINAASVRKEGEYQGLRFQASVNTLSDTDEHGFYIALGEHTLDSMRNAIENGHDSIGGKKLINKKSNGSDTTFAVTIYDIIDTYYASDITVVAYVKIGDSYITDKAVTRNIAEVTMNAISNGETGTILSIVAAYLSNHYMVKSSGLNVFNEFTITPLVTTKYNYNNLSDLYIDFLNDYNDATGFNLNIDSTLLDFYTSFKDGINDSDYTIDVADNIAKMFSGTMFSKWSWLLEYFKDNYNDNVYSQANALLSDTRTSEEELHSLESLIYSLWNFFHTSSDHGTYESAAFANEAAYSSVLWPTVTDFNDVNVVEVGTLITLPDSPYKNGYTFVHFSDGTNNYDSGDSYIVTTNAISFVSCFNNASFTITYHLDNGINNANNPSSYNIGDNIVILQDATREGYTFGGWYLDDNFADEITIINTNVEQQVDVYAKWICHVNYVINDSVCTITGYNSECNTNNIVILGEYEGTNVKSIRSAAFNRSMTLVSVCIKDGVLDIGNNAFRYCTSLTNITIPNTVTNIGYKAFEECTSLLSINIPNSVTSISGGAFTNCTALTKVNINSLESWCRISFADTLSNPLNYAHYLYLNDSILTSIIIPGSITTIGDYAFYNCRLLTSITIPESVTNIGDLAFANCFKLVEVYNKSNLSITVGAANYGNVAYYAKQVIADENDSKLTLTLDGFYIYNDGTNVYVINYIGDSYDITIPNTATIIDDAAFSGCKLLRSVTIPNSVTKIGNYAFLNCSSLIGVTMSNNVTNIGDAAFSGCTSLTDFTFPDSVISIGEYAFAYCTSLTSVTILGNVTSICDQAFYNCEFLEKVNITGLESWCGISFESSTANPLTFAHNIYFNDELITNLVIPNSVTVIGNYTFNSCSSLTSIIIPDTVTSIGVGAFSSCTSLTSVTIPNSLTSIGDYAFSNCTALTNTPIGNNVTNIGNYAFQYCTMLTSIAIPNSVINIGNAAFGWCDSLVSVTISNGVTSIGAGAFRNTKLVTITIPDSITSIGDSAFFGCYKLVELINYSNLNITKGDYGLSYVKQVITEKGDSNLSLIDDEFYLYDDGTDIYLVDYIGTNLDIIIPDNVTMINDYAFYKCELLTSVTISDAVTNIGSYSFYYCSSLTSITIPDSVTSIGNYAFSGCTSLTSITIPDSVTSIGNYAFSGCTSLTSITIPDSVTSIGNYAFNNCVLLSSITIPNSVTMIGSKAFRKCSSLENITFLNNVTNIGDGAFVDCEKISKVNINNIEDWLKTGFCSLESNPIYNGGNLYLNEDLLEEVKIPYGEINIGNWQFAGCKSIASITIPDSVTNIGTGAFYDCTSLTSITIPNGVTSIGDYAFVGCSSLTSITIPESVTGIGDFAFDGCSSLTSITIPDGVTSIGSSAFSHCTSLKNIIIPDSVTSIEQCAFQSCTSLTNIWIGENLSYIGNSAFYKCDLKTIRIKSVKTLCDITMITHEDWYGYDLYINDELVTDLLIPENVVSINSRAFYGCTSLTSITIPNSVTSIGSYSFYYCSSLTSITISDSVTSIGNYAFSGCTSLTSITIPDSVTSIGNYAFSGCTSLTSVTIPDGVIRIDDGLFYGCTSLESVIIPNSVTAFGIGPFTKDTSLNGIYYEGTKEEYALVEGKPLTTVYYYSANLPAESGDFWHYIDGKAVVWL